MDLYLIRHAIAEERDAARWPDDTQRPLSGRGRRRFRRAAPALRRLIPSIDLVLASPAARAWETAIILEREARWPAPRECTALTPATPAEEALRTLSRRMGPERLALVGHEPQLSQLAGLLVGSPALAMDWKKGGLVWISTPARPTRGAGRLRWILPPRVLRGVAAGSLKPACHRRGDRVRKRRGNVR